MSCRIVNHGAPISGSASPASNWTDNCPTDANIVWPTTGDKDVQVDGVANFAQSLDLAATLNNADRPNTEEEEGDGTEIVVNGWEFSQHWPNNTAGNRTDFNNCDDCGAYSRAASKQYTVKSGNYGRIETPNLYHDNSWCGKFKTERRAEILLTDESETRGYRCGFSIKIESDRVDVVANSEPSTSIIGPDGQTYTARAFKFPASINFNVSMALYIKRACDVNDEYGEYNEAIVPYTVQLETAICRELIALERQTYSAPGRWEAKTEAIPTSRSSISDCRWGYIIQNFGLNPTVEYNNCWYPNFTNYTWSEPGEENFPYYTLPSSSLSAEMRKYETELWALLNNPNLSESPWQKFPIYGDIDLRLTKRSNQLTLHLTRNPGIEPITITDPFLNRILKVTGATGTTVTTAAL